MKKILFVFWGLISSSSYAMDYTSLKKCNPADYDTYITAFKALDTRKEGVWEYECILAMMHGLCETFYSFNRDSLAFMRTVFKKNQSLLKNKSWCTSLMEKQWLKESNYLGYQLSRQFEYSAEDIFDIRNSILIALESFLNSKKEDSALFSIIQGAFNILNRIRDRKNLNDALQPIEDYL